MNCTKCKSGVLQPSFLDGLFRAHTCSGCGGNWILVEDFVAWKEQNSEFQFAADHTVTEDTEDTKKALLCPVTGTIMRKFKITAGTDHRVDYSAPGGGIWLDKGEWDLLKSEQVAGTLNNVVTQHWQKQIQRESSASNLSAIYSQKFVEENYEKVKAIRAWLINQPNKADLRAYLLAEDPYSASK